MKNGNTKTNIFLIGFLVTLAMLLFIFVSGYYNENRNIATQSLRNANNCIDISYLLYGQKYVDNSLLFEIKNNPASIKIDKITLLVNNKTYEKNVNIIVGDVSKVLFSDVLRSEVFSVYPNNCVQYVKTFRVV